MKIDRSRLNKIGIDRVVLNNFNIKNFESLNKKETITDLEYTEFFKDKNKLFNLNYSTHLRSNGDVYVISSLEFNPNKIINGHNIYNSTPQDLLDSLKYLVRILKKNGVELDISDVKIKTIEINITFIQDFKNLEEIITMIGGSNHKKSLGLHSYEHKKKLKNMKKDRSIYINSKVEENKRDIKGKIIKIYDKSFELKRDIGLHIDRFLTRVEVVAGRDYYREYMKSLDLSNSLSDLVNRDNILQILFEKSIEQEISIKPQKYLVNVIEKKLRYDFLNFRRNEVIKRNERKKLNELGKEIPQIYKEERGVFEYLKRESWIFDSYFLTKIVMEEIGNKSRGKFLKQISEKYTKEDNLDRYKKLLKILNLQ